MSRNDAKARGVWHKLALARTGGEERAVIKAALDDAERDAFKRGRAQGRLDDAARTQPGGIFHCDECNSPICDGWGENALAAARREGADEVRKALGPVLELAMRNSTCVDHDDPGCFWCQVMEGELHELHCEAAAAFRKIEHLTGEDS